MGVSVVPSMPLTQNMTQPVYRGMHVTQCFTDATYDNIHNDTKAQGIFTVNHYDVGHIYHMT